MKQIVREAVWVCSCYKVCLWGVTVTNFTERVLARIEFPISVLPFVVATLGAIIWNSLTVHDFFARVLLKVKKGALLACFISIILLLLVIGRQNWTTQASTMDLLWCKRSLQGYPFILLVDVLRFLCRSAVAIRELFGYISQSTANVLQAIQAAHCHFNKLWRLVMSLIFYFIYISLFLISFDQMRESL